MQIKIKKRSAEALLSLPEDGLTVLLVVGLTLYFPVPCFHGLFATRQILLLEERCTVGCDLREVFGAVVNRGRDGTETQTGCDAILRLADVLTVGVTLADVDTRAIRILGRSGAVRTNQVKVLV